MKKNFFPLLALLLIAVSPAPVFSQQPSEQEQLITLRNELSALKKTSKKEKELMQAEIETLQMGAHDAGQLFNTHDVRLMTNKMLIQGVVEGTLAQLKESQETTSAGYARTRKILWAALGFGAFAMCSFIIALVLILRRNKKNFFRFTDRLTEHAIELAKLTRAQEKDFNDLKEELSRLCKEVRLGAQTRQKAIDETYNRIAGMEKFAQAHKKTIDETCHRIAGMETSAKAYNNTVEEKIMSASTSLIALQNKLEDVQFSSGSAMNGTKTEIQKITDQIKAMDKLIHKIKIKP